MRQKHSSREYSEKIKRNCKKFESESEDYSSTKGDFKLDSKFCTINIVKGSTMLILFPLFNT